MALGRVAAVGPHRIEERAMTFKIVQDATPADQSHWRWSVWLDAPKEELDTVKDVIWKLHPSFSRSEVRVSSRKTGFRLKSSGWGEFEIQAEVRRLNGEKISLRHWLRFKQTAKKSRSSFIDAEAAPASTADVARRHPTVFLSYTSTDARLAGVLTEKLKHEHDFNVFVDVDIPAGEDLNKWVYEKITESDAVVFLLPQDPSASWNYTSLELGLATKVGAQVIPVLRADSKIPDSLEQSKAIRISGGGSFEMDAQNIAQRISDIIV
jgi:prokaryotic YEATS domain/TIR domain